MHRIDSSGATADHLFTDGDETHGVEATTVDAAFLNAVQGELCAVIEGAGLTLAKGDHTQLAQAIAALIASKAVTIGEASETVAGILKLATQAMVDAGTDGKAAVTPATLTVRLAAVAPLEAPAFTGIPTAPTAPSATNTTQLATTAFVQSLFSSTMSSITPLGYYQLPGGLLVQWGATAHPAGGNGISVTLTYPIAFPSEVYTLIANDTSASGMICNPSLTSNAGATINISQRNGDGFYAGNVLWIAFGR